MARRFNTGDKVHNWKVIQYVANDMKTTSPTLRIRLRVECVCGIRETLPQYYLVRDKPKLHCGCLTPVSLQMQHPLSYHSWYMMRVRCTDPKHIMYRHYGGRGISVCPQWFDWETGFAQFLKDMGPRPNQKLTLDRYPNNNGNYEPTNCRWATGKEQAANKGR